MKDVMVDIEAFGAGKNCCIVQIGACYFDRDTGAIGATFDMNVDARFNGDIDPDTVYWWLNQSDAARQSILKEPRIGLHIVLIAFNAFMKNAACVWSHATYDFVSIMNAYSRENLKPSFSYRTARDIRTLVDLSGIRVDSVPREGTHHNGLADAIHQVKYCVKAFKALEN